MWWYTWSEKRYRMNGFKLSLVSAAFLKHNPSFLFEKNRVICRERDNLYTAQETEGRCCLMFIIYFHHRVFLWDRLADPKPWSRTYTWRDHAVFIQSTLYRALPPPAQVLLV